MNRFIMRDGKKIELTWKDEQMLLKQTHIQIALNAIENICEFDTIEPDNDVLEQIGKTIEERTYSDNGEIEWDVLNGFGLVAEENYK